MIDCLRKKKFLWFGGRVVVVFGFVERYEVGWYGCFVEVIFISLVCL